MTEIDHSYPFDPTGSKGSNRITGEKQALSPPAWKDYHFIIPKLAPFFRGSLKVFDQRSGRELIEGVDWMATHRFIDASRACAHPIYGSITFYDKTIAGVVRLEYQTLGGDWTIDGDLITEILVHKSSNPRITTWDETVDLPFQFPVIDHEYDLDDLVGMSDVKKSLEGISKTILDTRDVRPIVRRHMNDDDNPHSVTKAQVGLGNVKDFGMATRGETLDGESDTTYMTPHRTRQSIEKFGYQYTDEHEQRKNNPHRVNKAQVGLGNVENLGLASKGQAEQAYGHNSYMTPERTGQAVTALVRNDFDKHTDNERNPHRVTKSQVGLSEVANYPPSSKLDAERGESTDSNMTPLRVKQSIIQFGYQYTDKHEKRQDNPHGVTKAQVGLKWVENFSIATRDDAEEGESNSKYMTPHRTQQAISAQVSQAHKAHVKDYTNPHRVNKAQVGLGKVDNFAVARDYQAEVGRDRDAYMTPKSTKLAINAQVGEKYYSKEEIDGLIGGVTIELPKYIDHRVINRDPHGVTKRDIGLGGIDDHSLLEGRDFLGTLESTRDTLLLLVNHHNSASSHDITNDDVGLGSISNVPYLTVRGIDNKVQLPDPSVPEKVPPVKPAPDRILYYILEEDFNG